MRGNERRVGVARCAFSCTISGSITNDDDDDDDDDDEEMEDGFCAMKRAKLCFQLGAPPLFLRSYGKVGDEDEGGEGDVVLIAVVAIVGGGDDGGDDGCSASREGVRRVGGEAEDGLG